MDDGIRKVLAVHQRDFKNVYVWRCANRGD